MTSTFPPLSSAFHGNHWDKSLPNRSDDSEYDARSPREKSRTKRAPRQSQAHSDKSSPEQTWEDAPQTWGGSDDHGSPAHSVGFNTHQSAWIHRDKLVEIENREMQQAGLEFDPVHSSTLNYQHTDYNRPTQRQSLLAGQGPLYQSSPDRTYAHDDSEGVVETQGFGYEDKRPRQASSPTNQRSESRSGTSRIPVSRTSPAPVPNEYRERDSPLGRNREASLDPTFSPDTPSTKQRPRSQSLVDGPEENTYGRTRRNVTNSRPLSEHMGSPATSIGSPIAAAASPNSSDKITSRKNPEMRKTSTSRAGVANATLQKASPARSTKSRPNSVHRPEGEAPWLATMYKPDPMLPPDQQMLPTHAKRMMQEQWAREGKTGDTYDRNFNLLNAKDISGKGKSPSDPTTSQATEEKISAAGTSAHTVRASSNSGHGNSTTISRPTSISGGYRITPVIGPPMELPQSRPQSRGQSMSRHQTAQHMPSNGRPAELPGAEPPLPVHRLDPEKLSAAAAAAGQKDRERKGCGCCVVM